MASWEQALVASLSEFKTAGHSFDYAWFAAIKSNPPRSEAERRGSRWVCDECFRECEDKPLLCVCGSIELSEEVGTVEVMRRACEVAWHDRRPRLSQFTAQLVDSLDLSGSARHLNSPSERMARVAA